MLIKRVGVIGLGNMGLPMATTLAKKGFEVIGFDLSEARRDLAAAQGIRPVGLADLLRTVDVVVSSLPYARDVEAVLNTPDGLAGAARQAGGRGRHLDRRPDDEPAPPEGPG